MNNKVIGIIKEDVCEELNKMSFRYDMVDVRFDIEPKGLVLAGLSKCLNELELDEGAELEDYEMIITNIRIDFQKI